MKRVLIADDDLDVCQSTADLLRAAGMEAIFVQEAGEVLATVRAWRPDLLLQDVRMPGLDLAAHVRAIRAEADGSPAVVLFTAALSVEEFVRRVGADGGIEKPFDPDALLQLIHKLAS